MNRQVDLGLTRIFANKIPKYMRPIATIIGFAFIFNLSIYICVRLFIKPFKIANAISSTTTTTSTTTPQTTTQASFVLGCFFYKTNVTLADNSIRPLNSLSIGDEVFVYSSSGQIKKSRILTIFHHQRSIVRFLEIYTDYNDEPLRLTEMHSILTKKPSINEQSYSYDFASNIAVGDFLLSSKLKPSKVTNIKETILYNQIISTPLTFEGNIVANDLIASSYGTFAHKYMHLLTTPIRYWYQVEAFAQFNDFLVHFIDIYAKLLI